MTFEEAKKLPDTNWKNKSDRMKTLMFDSERGNYYWLWIKNAEDDKYHFDFSERELK